MVRLGATAGVGIALSCVAAIGSFAGWWSVGLAVGIQALTISALLGLVAWGSADPGLELFGPAVRRGDPSRGALALTFDDGPHPESTSALLDILRSEGAQATFFLLVDHAEAHPELAKAIAQEHEIGLHGMSHHPWLTLRSVAAGSKELSDARARLEHITGSQITLYRPPFGAVSPRLLSSVAAAGLSLVWCSVRTRDGGRLTEAQVRERCQAADAGDIVLLHEGREPTTKALPAILRDLAARNLQCLTVGDLCESQ